MKRSVLLVFLVVFVTAVFSSGAANAAAAARGWTPVMAAAKLKATWTTVDPKAYAEIQEHIDALLKAGGSPDDPIIVALRDDQRKAKHAAKVTSAKCAGVGKPARRYTVFRCTARVAAEERTPPDNQFYTASVKVTVTTAKGFVVRASWR